MITIGTFNATADGYTGIIETLGTRTVALIEPAAPSNNDKAPDFRIFTGSAHHEVGAAWQSRVPDTGALLLSVKLDDPSFAEPIHCRLIKVSGSDTYQLIWDRNRKRA